MNGWGAERLDDINKKIISILEMKGEAAQRRFLNLLRQVSNSLRSSEEIPGDEEVNRQDA